MSTLARKAAVVIALFSGVLLGGRATGYSQESNQQCYYDPDVDPPTACSTCSNTCLGTGYKCCQIVIITH